MSFIPFNSFNKNQVILTSDRLIFNARADSIFLLSNKDVAISANNDIHINNGGNTIINSKRIQLGLGNDVQPLAKADSLVITLNKLLSSLTDLSTALSSAIATGVGVSSLLSINTAGQKLQASVQNIKADLDKIKSKTSFTN